MGRAINKLFYGIEKYKIKSCIIYLPENQASLPSIRGKKLGLNFYRALTMQITLVWSGDGSGLGSIQMGSKK